MVLRSPLVMAQRMSALRLGWAARVVATVLGNIGGSGLSTGLIGRGQWSSAGETFERLIELFEDIGRRGRRDRAYACKSKYMRVRSRTGVDVGSAAMMGKEYDSSKSVGLGVGGMKMAGAMPTYLLW